MAKKNVKINLMIPEDMDQALKEHSEETGMPVSEIIRRSVAQALKRQGKKVEYAITWGGSRRATNPETEEDTSGQRVGVGAG